MRLRTFSILSTLVILAFAFARPAQSSVFDKLFNCDTPDKKGCTFQALGAAIEKSVSNVLQNMDQFLGGKNTVHDGIRSSRVFAGPDQYPPTSFAAYGILVFPSRASEFDKARHKMICEAYVQSIPHESELSVNRKDQMVTVWPIETDAIASQANSAKRAQVCEIAIQSYGLVTAQETLKSAEAAGWTPKGIGPYLLAWSPPDNIGKSDAIVLAADLSTVNAYEQALSVMQKWRNDIEEDPTVWRSGWSVEKLRLTLKSWLDAYGPELLSAIGLKG